MRSKSNWIEIKAIFGKVLVKYRTRGVGLTAKKNVIFIMKEKMEKKKQFWSKRSVDTHEKLEDSKQPQFISRARPIQSIRRQFHLKRVENSNFHMQNSFLSKLSPFHKQSQTC